MSDNSAAQSKNADAPELGFILFEDYAFVDAFGPAEVFNITRFLNEPGASYKLKWYSLNGGHVQNGSSILTERLDTIGKTNKYPEYILVPGGTPEGVDNMVKNKEFIEHIVRLSEKSQFTMSVCTGAQILAAAGVLDGKKATANKMLFSYVASFGPKVEWVKAARWVQDGKFFTASGLTAGIDMALGFLAFRHSTEFARKVSSFLEHEWHEDSTYDPFVKQIDAFKPGKDSAL